MSSGANGSRLRSRAREIAFAAMGIWYAVFVHIENLEGLTRLLQASISPVALISGVGLLILSQTNRFSRVAERLREFARQRQESPAPDVRVNRQVEIFLHRSRILRLAIATAILSVLLVSIMVLLIFAMAVLDLNAFLAVLLLFALSLVSLIVSLIAFLYDMQLSLRATDELLKQTGTIPDRKDSSVLTGGII
jgi:hypothetical protein